MTTNIPRTGSVQLILLIIIVIGMIVYAISTETERALTEEVRQKLVTVASVTASQIDVNALSSLQPGDENSTRFTTIRDQLHKIKQLSKDIKYIYTMRKAGDNIAFIVDGDYGIESDSPAIGERYPDAEPELFQGFTAPIADQTFTTDKWGTVISGFSPIRDQNNTTVGIVGVDMDSTVITDELIFLKTILFLVGLLAALGASVGVVIIDRRRQKDELKLIESEEKYRFLFERAGDAIFFLEAKGERTGAITAANEAASIMHGYSTQELCSMNIEELQPEQDRKIVHQLLFEVRSGQWIRKELNHKKKDGTVFPVETSAGMLDLGVNIAILIMNRDITDRRRTSKALEQASKKLNLLNAVTFNDIQNVIFSLQGYLELEKSYVTDKTSGEFLEKEEELVRKISRQLDFSKNYQDLGTKPPRWQNVNQVFIMAISHLDFTSISRTIHLDNLEIFVDPLFEQVFLSLASNIICHSGNATSLLLEFREKDDGLVIIFEDDGEGIADNLKEKIFKRGFGTQKGMGLFLVREILGITGVTIRETGAQGEGIRFEISVPYGAYSPTLPLWLQIINEPIHYLDRFFSRISSG